MGQRTAFYQAGFTDAQVTRLKNLSGTELAYLDGITPGTVTASKALIVDASRDLTGSSAATAIRNLRLTNLDAGISGTAGTVDIFPSTASKGKIQIAAADSAGDTTTTITNASQAGARTYTIPDAGASASFVMTEGAQTINGTKTYGGQAQWGSGTGISSTQVYVGGSGGIAGDFKIYPGTSAKGHIVIQAIANTGDTALTIANAAQAAGRTFTIPDPSSSASTDANWAFAMVRSGSGAPSGFAATIPSFYVDTANGKLYTCTAASATSATFALVGTQS